jgi:hypothetical protein
MGGMPSLMAAVVSAAFLSSKARAQVEFDCSIGNITNATYGIGVDFRDCQVIARKYSVAYSRIYNTVVQQYPP